MSERLSEHTTLRLGGPAQRFVVAGTEGELVDHVREADARGEPVLILGGGSNLVVADEGFDGTVIKIQTTRIEVERRDGAAFVRAEAGASWDALVARAAGEGWSGVEALSGIPGSVGATPMQNVGAYGQEVAGVITRVRIFDRARGEASWIAAGACGFSYRSSHFRGRSDRIVLEVELRLPEQPLSAPIRYTELARALGVSEGARAPIGVVRETVIALRRRKGMVLDDADPDSRSAGSFFTNPIVDASVADRVESVAAGPMPRFDADGGRVKLAAGWLIERAGFQKGQRFGRVHVSTKHALALCTEPGASTRELLDAARAIQRGVHDRFGVTLEPEPILIGCALGEKKGG